MSPKNEKRSISPSRSQNEISVEKVLSIYETVVLPLKILTEYHISYGLEQAVLPKILVMKHVTANFVARLLTLLTV